MAQHNGTSPATAKPTREETLERVYEQAMLLVYGGPGGQAVEISDRLQWLRQTRLSMFSTPKSHVIGLMEAVAAVPPPEQP